MELTTILIILEIITGLVALCSLGAIIIRPIRERVFSFERTREGERCLLRSEMLRIYYSNVDAQKIRQYERENFIKCYDAYKALRGNSFVDDINLEVRTWTIVR